MLMIILTGWPPSFFVRDWTGLPPDRCRWNTGLRWGIDFYQNVLHTVRGILSSEYALFLVSGSNLTTV